MERSLLQRLSRAVEAGEEAVLCTVVDAAGSTPRGRGAAMLVFPDSTEGTIGGGITEHRVALRARGMLKDGTQSELYREALSAREAAADGAVCGGEVAVFLERYGRDEELVILGAGHVGRALARLAAAAGMAVLTWDEREEFASPQNIPWGKTLSCPLETALGERITLHPSSYVVVVTRGHALDAEAVRLLEGKPCAYIGMIGSRQKIALVRERLLKEGVTPGYLDGIYQPVGLPIGAETPEEIAVSVLAEIVAVKRGANPRALRLGCGHVPWIT